MEYYWSIKNTHVVTALLSGAIFLFQGMLMWRASPWQKTLWFRYLPHVVDSVLLLSAIALAWITRQAPWEVSWLGTKLWVLLAYILCGAVALKRGPTMRIRRVFLFVALGLYAQIIATAVTRNPAGLLAWLG